jgi:hypothetical protein
MEVGVPLIRNLIGLAALLVPSAHLSAGPPYATDDPEPTERGHWEIYAFTTGTRAHGSLEGTAGVDLNYGPVANVQLTATLPVAFAGDGRTHAGFGDVELGAKYRFLPAQRAGIAIAVFPRVILPTGGRRFGSGRVRLLLPVWAQKDFGPWSLFGGGGYTVNPGFRNRDFWQSGLALTRTMTPRLSLGAEIVHEAADEVGGHGTTSANVGGIYRLGGPFSLLFSGGPGFEHHRDGAQINAYVALGLDF